MTEPIPDDDALELINTEITARLNRQGDAAKVIDTKAGILGTLSATAATFLASRQDPQPVWAGFAFGMFAVTLGLALWCLRIAKYKDAPDPRELGKGYPFEPKRAALIHLIQERVEAFAENAARQKRRARLWGWSLATLTAGLVLAVVAIVQTGLRDGADQRQSAPGRGGSTAATR